MMSKILLVEDDVFLRQLYNDLLVEEKYEVETADDGDSGYEKLKRGGWDLVLLDMNMPGMSGLEILKKLKEEKVTNLAGKIIFMTASGSTKDVTEMQELSDGYLIKSDLNPEEFIFKVKGFLGTSTI